MGSCSGVIMYIVGPTNKVSLWSCSRMTGDMAGYTGNGEPGIQQDNTGNGGPGTRQEHGIWKAGHMAGHQAGGMAEHQSGNTMEHQAGAMAGYQERGWITQDSCHIGPYAPVPFHVTWNGAMPSHTGIVPCWTTRTWGMAACRATKTVPYYHDNVV